MKYKFLPQPDTAFLQEHASYHPLLVTLLWQRGILTKEEIDAFLNPYYGNAKYDPFQFKEMEIVVERVLEAVDKKERVLVYGDYDADGVTSSVLLIEMFEKLYCVRSFRGAPQCDIKSEELIHVYLPHRELEGYGLNLKAVEYIKKQEIDLVIACDCGSTNRDELFALKDVGIDVIILDHHLVPKERPPVTGFINPKFENETYPFINLAACGVVFKVIQAIRQYLQKNNKQSVIDESFEKWSLDLVAIATVSDVMPLKAENRVFVKWGLLVLNKTKRIGLQAMIHCARLDKQIGTYEISFIIAPRINAASRLDHANVAFDLLRSRDREAAIIDAQKLEKTNTERQKLTEKIFLEAKEIVQEQLQKNAKTLVAYNTKKNEWGTGIIGLVAGKLASEFNRPSFVIGLSEHGLSGSGRSIPITSSFTKHFDIAALVKHCGHLFLKSGGHPSACGFTFKQGLPYEESIAEFIQCTDAYSNMHLQDEDLLLYKHISLELRFKDITFDLVDKIIELLKPFGEENPEPIFLTRKAKVMSVRNMGINGAHTKLYIEDGGTVLEAVSFRSQNHIKEFAPGNFIDIIYTIEANIWNGTRSIQLILKEGALS